MEILEIEKRTIDGHFPGADIKFIGEGWHNKAYLINDCHIIRFGKTAHSKTRMTLYNKLYPKLASDIVSIPKYSVLNNIQNSDTYTCYAIYPYIQGKHVAYAELPEVTISDLAKYISHIHSTDYGDALELVDFLQEIKEELNIVMPALASVVTTEEHDYIKSVYESHIDSGIIQEVRPVLIHSDLTEVNMLIDGTALSVIDWDGLQLEDPVYELGVFPYDLFKRLLCDYENNLGENITRRYLFHRMRREILAMYYCTSPTYADKLQKHIDKFRSKRIECEQVKVDLKL